MMQMPKDVVTRWLDLVRLAQAGDEAALEQLLGELRPWILFWAYPHCDAHLIEDVAQRVLLQVWRRLDQLRSARALCSWVRQITRHMAWEVQRNWSASKGGNAPKSVALEDCEELLPDRSPDPQDQQQRQELIELVRQGVSQLPDLFQSMLRDRLAGMSLREISIRHGRPEGTIKRQLHEARKVLHLWLVAKLAA